jgi:hypothetical protein
LFGAGIVATPENFGNGGAPPAHPELLDWLAVEFQQGGWRVKPLIRLIMMSAVYRQAAMGAAGDNATVVGQMPMKRLEAEVIRDSALAVSGMLDAAMDGAPIMLEAKADGSVDIARKKLSSPTAEWRRSVYLLSRRAFHPTLLSVFDQPVLATNCPERSRSAVPLQSLAMPNGPFLFDMADHFARRIAREAGPRADQQIDAAFRLALGRAPDADELGSSVRFLERQTDLYLKEKLPPVQAKHKALVHLCHALMNTSEFLYAP